MLNRRLAGKIAIVTGASSGIGEATAIALAASGAKVAIVARRRDRLDALTQRIHEAGDEAISIPTDVTDEAQVREMVQTVQSKLGRVDILVNNAGISLDGAISDTDPENWRRMVDTNLLGTLYGMHSALPIMKSQGEGHIINVSSGAGRWLYPSTPVYSGIKFAVSNMTEQLRRQVGKEHIRVTCIEPGFVDTEIYDHMDLTARKEAEFAKTQMSPLHSEDIADAILYAVTRPPHVNVNILNVYPTEQTQ